MIDGVTNLLWRKQRSACIESLENMINTCIVVWIQLLNNECAKNGVVEAVESGGVFLLEVSIRHIGVGTLLMKARQLENLSVATGIRLTKITLKEVGDSAQLLLPV